MSIAALLDEMVAALNAADIPFMLTGSFAAAVHGAGRATMDVDFVIDPDAAALDAFVEGMLRAGRYVSPDAAREALAERSMFNIVDVESGWKIDLVIRKDRAFSRTEFSRRSTLALGALRLPVATVEDLVLAKLEWARLGGSARQLEDVRALLQAAGERFDHAYVAQWIETLGIGHEWRAAVTMQLAVRGYDGSWFEGNYGAYIEDLKRRKGADADQPHRIKYKPLVRK